MELFTRKIGPLPGWAWLAIGVVGFIILRSRGKSSSASTGAGLTPDAQTGLVSALQAALGGLAQVRPGDSNTSTTTYNIGAGGKGPVRTPVLGVGNPPQDWQLNPVLAGIHNARLATGGGGGASVPQSPIAPWAQLPGSHTGTTAGSPQSTPPSYPTQRR